ncbi:DUF397 domain-containing protein [Streptomyces sp. ME19-01-6]|uniref:DUF397 domain-containing protein n=1 Tax=Streptomyces sp. ME19-01-6 TaxID=3028686 RepID=UPI0029B51005|nr:DUF397 domain-containing protein [Streptomyces sp. ME19-01-6]MDX3228227.1 DUF397 domain-containing protein [Streptomyces sp. ME19-01-6]
MPILNWRKSSFSTSGANCVELATTHSAIHMRESDDPGTVIHTTPTALRSFIRAVKTGRLDHTI